MYDIDRQAEETLELLGDIPGEELPSLRSFEFVFDRYFEPDEVRSDLSPLMTKAVRELSYSLENFSVDGVVDVSLFFAPFSSDN
ncbi:hypothetical protein VPNG_01478 [Cytospora leucostoma]|uniref:Uncharacterized protein n=1 Tax=Cytospora leucostoma TaxID=1230097 RepID=A0A423XJU7_9PEZI|nr:hypothetical protein VPNG_01478 [Cytospora leucostoma]